MRAAVLFFCSLRLAAPLALAGAKPLLMVYDNRIMRKDTCDEKREAIERMPGKKISIDNPAGTLSTEAEMAVRLAFDSPPAKVQVNGEEDLMVLPCLAFAPEGCSVYYGQPKQGVVRVVVTKETRERAKKIMLSMEEILG